MAGLKNWAMQVLIALDQLITALVGGFADETLSSYSYRMEQQGKPWGVARRFIDFLFFEGHCEQAYLAEIERHQLPPEFRHLP